MNLAQIRKRIDEFDRKIIELLNDRTRLVMEIGKMKMASGQEAYAPERENEIYRKIEELAAKGPLPADSLKVIYREVMSASLALEKKPKIAYLGPEATFTHLASLSKFGESVDYVPLVSINEVFREVEQRRADYGVIPIENSIEGAVTHSLDMFYDSDLRICSEIFFEIAHFLMSHSPLKSIKRIYSKPEVFGQCRLWLEANAPRVELVDTSSTTVAAQRAQKEEGAAAIASRLASTIYNLPVVAGNIQDFSSNVTRFLVISRSTPKTTGQDKTSMLVSVKDKVGALHEMLEPFKKYKINMTKIESRPSKKRAWEYYFFIDFQGHIDDSRTKKMLSSMEKKVKFIKILGSYPTSCRKDLVD